MTATGKEVLVKELAEMIQARVFLDKRIESQKRAIKELTRSELENSSRALPYLNGRISTHAKKILEERGATLRSDLVDILRAGGAGRLAENGPKEIDKALNRCLDLGTIRETSTGLVNADPAKPVKKSSLFSKKKK